MRWLENIRSQLLRKRPPRNLSKALEERFTMGGIASIVYAYDDSSQRKNLYYTRDEVDTYINKALKGEETEYGSMDGFIRNAVAAFPIKGLEVAIIGSEKPRYEALCLANGARPVTIEYSVIPTNDSRLEITTPARVFGSGRKFDAAISLSTYEHSGLGRYGDPVDPEGDLTAMAQLKTVVKKGGIAYIAVPVGQEAVFFNLHRIYGSKRLALLHQGWEVLGSFGFKESDFDEIDGSTKIHQPVFVLRNPSTA
jgi:hypothetical protein